MKTLVITNDFSPKKGGISTYIKSFTENLDFETFIYAPNWAEGDKLEELNLVLLENADDVFTEIIFERIK